MKQQAKIMSALVYTKIEVKSEGVFDRFGRTEPLAYFAVSRCVVAERGIAAVG